MATDTATAPPNVSSPDPTRNYWQVPLFLVALVLFVATWQGWIGWLIGPRDSSTEHVLNLETLRNSEEKVAPDIGELKSLLEKVAGNIDLSTDKHDTHFILGSGYAKLAELTIASEEARNYWLLAQQHFDLVDRELLGNKTEGAKTKLGFRSAKARVAIGLPPGTDPRVIIDLIQILDSIPMGDDPGEALRLRADLALKLSPPELGIAKDSLHRYLTGGLSTPAIFRERTKIQLADLHFRCGEMDKAHERLSDIAPDAPADVVVAGKALLGRVHMAESHWAAAAREWEVVRATPNLTPSLRLTATYLLGVCRLNTHEPEAAVKLFEESIKSEDSPETSGAAFRLAEQYLKSSDPARRVIGSDLLAKAMKDVKSIQDLRNNKLITLLDINDIRATFELAFSKLAADGAYEEALKGVSAFAPIAESGRDREKRAEILANWAIVLKEKTKQDFKPKALEAAREYLAFETLQSAVSAKADTLRKAAAMFKLGDQPTEAVIALQTASKLPKLPEELAGEVWLDLADALIAAKRLDEVWPALNEAMGAGGTISMKTRYRIARHFKDTRKPELCQLARYLYEQIAKQTNLSPTEQEFQERALLDLGDEYIKLTDFSTAEIWLRQQIHTYPTGPQAPVGRLMLGVCLLQLALVTGPTGPPPAKVVSLRNEALKLFREIVALEDEKLKKTGTLNETDAWLRVQAAIRILQTYLQMNNHTDLLGESADLLQRYRGTVEELIIWNLIYHSFKNQGDKVKMLQTRDKMKEVFDALPPDAFNSSALEYTRAYWEKNWFTEK